MLILRSMMLVVDFISRPTIFYDEFMIDDDTTVAKTRHRLYLITDNFVW